MSRKAVFFNSAEEEPWSFTFREAASSYDHLLPRSAFGLSQSDEHLPAAGAQPDLVLHQVAVWESVRCSLWAIGHHYGLEAGRVGNGLERELPITRSVADRPLAVT